MTETWMPVVIAVAVFIGCGLLFYIGSKELVAAGNKYQNVFTKTAEMNLTEMFIFIDPKKIYSINLIVIAFTFILIWLFSGKWIPAMLCALFVGATPRRIWLLLRQQRQKIFLKELPDSLISLATMMRSGANLSMALENLVSESEGPIAQEFGLFLRELRIGVDYVEALDHLHERMPLSELEMVVAGMKISREIGGSLAEMFSRLADTLRRKSEMEGKIKALTAQGKAQGYVMTLLPIALGLVLFKMESQAMLLLFTTPWGWATCTFFVVWISLGYKFIKKIVSIDV